MKNLLITIITAATIMSCTSNAGTNAKIEEARQAAIDSMHKATEIEAIKQAAIDSVNRANEKAEATEKVIYVHDNDNNSASPATKTQRKKMNNVAKGALIGAGAGAITGAVVSKKKGQGAIIGGVVGAGAGAATGAIIDRNKKNN
jgi:PBP1b-binding outer membrane lipoprotein LpoB